MVKCVAAFMDFCYLVRRNGITSDALHEIENKLEQFHRYRTIFIRTGVRMDISLPRQHALKHYPRSIRLYGSPNGLCSSMTESKHIKAVKEPWRRSSRHKALVQMLRTNCRMDKMAFAQRAFARQGMMAGTTSAYMAMTLRGEQPAVHETPNNEDNDIGPASGPKVLSSIHLATTRGMLCCTVLSPPKLIDVYLERSYPATLEALSIHIQQPQLPELIHHFLYDQMHPNSPVWTTDIALDDWPQFYGRISVFHSAIARFYAPSDLCGAGGMYKEHIRSTPLWQGESARRDTVFVETDKELPGMRGMTIGHVFLFFSFMFRDVHYPCALVHWYSLVGTEPDEDTGLWVVSPEFEATNGRRSLAVIHLECIARGALLSGVCGSSFVPEGLDFRDTLDIFQAYFVNCYADHHAHEFLAT